MDRHVHVKCPALRELHLIASEDLVDDRLLAVHDLIVRQRQQILLVVEIEHRESQLVGDVNSLPGLLHEIVQRVIHPAQIPLVVKSEAALVHRLCAARIGRGVLGDQHGGRMELMQAEIHLLEEIQVEFVDAAALIAHPVDQAAHRIHSQAVKVILREPVVGGRLHKAGHLPAREQEIAASPLAVRHVGGRILIEFRSVVMPQRVIVHGKMRGDYVDDRADPRHVKAVDQLLQLLSRPVSGRRGKKARALVSPASVEGMLRERHEFHMCVIVVFDILDEILRDLIVLIPSLFHFPVRVVLPVRVLPLPGAEMHLVNIEGSVKIPSPVLHPLIVRELEPVQVPDNGREIRAQFHAESIGVAVLDPSVFAIDDELVHLSLFCPVNPDLIELGADGFRHLFFLPVIELAYDRDALRLRREGPEDHGVSLHMRPKILVCVIHISHVEFLKIHYPKPSLLFHLAFAVLFLLTFLYSHRNIQDFLRIVHCHADIFTGHDRLYRNSLQKCQHCVRRIT